MRFILVSAENPNLQRPLEVPDEIVKEEPQLLKKREKSRKKDPPQDPPQVQSKQAKTVQKSRVYG